ncbi:MAG: MBL fold metallo-hydrolase, partial [Pseudomonadota bacterium]
MRLRAIILGCGSSGGVPRPGGKDGQGDWGDCDPANPRNRRRRCSILVQRADPSKGWDTPDLTTILVDTSPDLREQLLSARVGRVDAVAWTHEHADQCHGIDDLRALVLAQRKRVPVWLHESTSPLLKSRFGYCFEDNSKTGYPAILDAHDLTT